MKNDAFWIKVCGVTSVSDAELAVDAGAHAIGLNLWPHSPRALSIDAARDIAAAVRGRVQVVAVTVNAAYDEIVAIQATLQPDYVQLHGDEPDSWVASLAPRAYRALGLAGADDVDRAVRCPGPWVLVDARDPVRHGGTGKAPPQHLAAHVCRVRRTVLAGGLGPANVAEAIAVSRPWGVDSTSRLESSPGRKDAQLVAQFVARARDAFVALSATKEGEV